MIIFNQRIAGQLMANGFVLQDVRENYKDKSKKVFIFKDSDRLSTFLNELKNKN